MTDKEINFDEGSEAYQEGARTCKGIRQDCSVFDFSQPLERLILAVKNIPTQLDEYEYQFYLGSQSLLPSHWERHAGYSSSCF